MKDRSFWPTVFVVLLVLGVHAAMVLVGVTPVLHGRLADTDNYMWLLRVQDLVDGKSWFDHGVPRMNAPYGDTLNWSRPTDVAILLLALPFRGFMSWHDAIFWGGAVLAPLQEIGLGAALVWAFAPFVRREARPLLMLLTLLQPALIVYTLAGRPDHHVFILMAETLYLGLCTRALLGGPASKQGFIAGLVMAFGLWTSVESELTLVLMLGLWAVLWAVTGERRLLDFAAGQVVALVVGILGALGIERGPALLMDPALDKISWVHLLLAGANALVWLPLRVRELPRVGQRIAALAASGTVGVLLVAALHPRALLGPSADIDPVVMRDFFLRIHEMAPLWPTSPARALLLLAALGSPLWGLLLWGALWRRGRIPGPIRPFLPLLVAATVLTGVALLHARFSMFAAPLGAGFLVVAAEAWMGEERSAGPLRVFARAGVLLAPFLLALVGVVFLPKAAAPAASGKSCSVADLAPFLADPTGLGARPRIVLAPLNYGPELLYFTPHAAVAGPYHRNRDGILDSFAFFRATSAEQAEAVVARRPVDLVLLCAGDLAELSGDGFARRLIDGAVPAWLSPVPLPDGSDFRLYQVRRASPASPPASAPAP